MSKTPEQIQRLTVLITTAVGLGIFLLMTGIGAWQYNHKKNLATTATPVTLNVAEVAQLCSVEKKVNKNWSSTGVHPCEEAARIVKENNGLTSWRSVPGDYATVTWESEGKSYSERFSVGAISDKPLEAGMQVAAYADPANPSFVEKPFSEADWTSFLTTSGIGAGIGIFSALLGLLIGRWNKGIQDSGIAAGGTLRADGRIVYPATDAAGNAVEFVTPTWARIIKYLGLAVLLLGSLLAVMAALGGFAKSDMEAVKGAVMILVLSVGIWKLLTYVASFGARPALPDR